MDPIDQYLTALGQIESSGNYGALGPVTNGGDRAYGKYQVMGNNIPAWTKQALGSSLTPSQFLNDPNAQDAVAKHYFGNYLNQYGNPQDAASMWFSGTPLSQGAGRSDGYNTGSQYVAKFNKALQGVQGDSTSPMDMAMLPTNATPDTGTAPASLTPAGTPANLINQEFASLNGPGSVGGPRSVVDQDFNTLNGSNAAQTPATRVAQGFGAINNDPTDLINGDFNTLGNPPANPQLLAALKAKMAGAALPSAASPTVGNNGLDQQNPGGAVGPGAPSAPSAPVGRGNNVLTGIGGALSSLGAGILSAYNPMGGAMLMNASNMQMMNALKAKAMMLPEWGQVGRDAFNQPVMGWINKLDQTINGQSTGASGQTNSGQYAAQNLDPNKPLYAQLDPARQAEVNGMIAGRIAMPTQRLLATPYYNQLLQAANEHAQQMGLPGFDQATWLASVQGRKDWANGGKSFMAMQGLDQLDAHALKASNAVENIANYNGNFTGMNDVRNWLANNTNANPQLRDALTEFQNSKSALTDEMSKAWKTGVMSDKEKEDWENKVNAASSPQILRRTLYDFEDLVDARRQQLTNGYKAQFGQDYASSPNALDQTNHANVYKLLHDRWQAGFNGSSPQGLPTGVASIKVINP